MTVFRANVGQSVSTCFSFSAFFRQELLKINDMGATCHSCYPTKGNLRALISNRQKSLQASFFLTTRLLTEEVVISVTWLNEAGCLLIHMHERCDRYVVNRRALLGWTRLGVS